MSTVTQHAIGTFCWVELGTNDQAAARAFYTSLFGWDAYEHDMGGGETYTLLRIGDDDVAALYQMRKEQLDQGIPPNWLSYVTVESADDSTRKATELGAHALMGPFDVYDLGRMSVLKDPTGATFALWQAKKHIGSSRINEVGALCWNELLTTDPDQAGRFYRGLFGWTTEPMPMGDSRTYTLFKLGDTQPGGMLKITPEMGPIPSNWMIYLSVADSDGTVEKAKKLGATPLMPPLDVPGVGRFAILSDPQGAVFAIVRMNAPAP